MYTFVLTEGLYKFVQVCFHTTTRGTLPKVAHFSASIVWHCVNIASVYKCETVQEPHRDCMLPSRNDCY